MNLIETPPRFEDEYPEEAAVLMDICQERGEARSKGKKNKPMFLDAVEPIKTEKTVGRNDPCFCGSGKKFKKCCM